MGAHLAGILQVRGGEGKGGGRVDGDAPPAEPHVRATGFRAVIRAQTEAHEHARQA